MSAISWMSDAELDALSHEPSGFGVLETSHGRLPLTALEVVARIEGFTAEIELVQTFKHSLAEPMEAVYIFPLPDRAAVTRFEMEAGGAVLEGVIDERARVERNAAVLPVDPPRAHRWQFWKR